MPATPFLAKMPRPALFALSGALAALLVALTAGELVWFALRPSPPAATTSPAPEPRTEPPAPAPSATEPRLALSAAPVTVYPGTKNTFGVRVARERFDGPVRVRFETPPALTAAEVTVPAGETGAKAEIVAPADAKPGAFALTATATAVDRPLSATAAVQVTVAAPPGAGPRLAVTAAPAVQVYQKGTNTFGVRAAREDFDGPVTVTFAGVPDGVKIPEVVIPAGKDLAAVEVTAGAGARLGQTTVTLTARATAKGAEVLARTDLFAEVLDPSRAPLDVVLVLDCTGTMHRSVERLSKSLPVLAEALNKSRFDARFGVVGFRDTTLGQPLEVPRIGGERLSGDAARFAAVVRGLRLGGGGGDGESSLDGIAEAADFPLREGGRIVLLVTDGGPKRVDGRIRSMDAAIKHLAARRIDQLHVVALAKYRKAFEPLLVAGKGQFYDLANATENNEFDRVMTELAKVIAEAVPPAPVPRPEPPQAPPAPVLPPLGGKPTDPPASRDPDEPRFPPAAPTPAPSPEPAAPPSPPAPEPAADNRPLALAAWAAAVVCLASLALLGGHWVLLPGEPPTAAVAATGYGGGLAVGLAAGALGYVALDATGIGLLTRLGAATLFGLGMGLAVPLAELLLSADAPRFDDPEPLPLPDEPPAPVFAPVPRPVRPAPAPAALDLDLPPVEAFPSRAPPPPTPAPALDFDIPPVEAYSPSQPKPPAKPPLPPRPDPAPLLDFDIPPVEAYGPAPAKPPPPAPPPPVPVHKPNITGAAKPDGCPGCGRKIPGAVGTRYCMVCDKTF